MFTPDLDLGVYLLVELMELDVREDVVPLPPGGAELVQQGPDLKVVQYSTGVQNWLLLDRTGVKNHWTFPELAYCFTHLFLLKMPIFFPRKN